MMSARIALVLWATALLSLPATAVEVINVPLDVGDLASAIDQIDDGGIIVLADGTYPTPVGGWFFANLGKSFTIRAADGATVVLDGSGQRPVFRLQNTDPAFGGQVVFDGLVFTGGTSTQNGVAGGVTIEDNDAVFVGCTFDGNGSNASVTGGGGAVVFGDAEVRFLGCTFVDNWAVNEGGGLKVGEGSSVLVDDSVFLNNRVNLAGHRPSSAGGAIHVGNGDITVTDSRFDGNQAGYVGGGMYVIGVWQDPVTVPRATAVVANCTFEDNRAEPAPGITPPSKTEGGGFHAEDQALARIFNSRFLLNRAETGGGVNLYRARVEISDSVFRGNRATATGANTGFGGAIAAISNDTGADGSNNRPSAELTVTDTLIQGSYQAVGTVGQIAGGVFASGDQNRQFGQNGVPASPNLSLNRADVSLQRVVVTDCTVTQSVIGTGVGAGANFGLVAGDVDDAMFLSSEAVGANSQAGGLRVIGQSDVTVDDTTFAGNQAQRFGGAVYVQGAELDLTGCSLIENTNGDEDFGAALFGAPDEAKSVTVTGAVTDSVISNTADRGLLVFDDDRQGSPSTPYNDLRYNGNTFFDGSAGTSIYRDPLAGGAKTAGELNSLVVNRTGGTPSTDKSQVDNTNPGSAPVVAEVRAAPTAILPAGAAGDPAGPTAAFVGYAWTGGNATLDGAPVSGFAGLSQVGAGSHVLDVGGTQAVATVATAPSPAATLSATPTVIASGEQTQLGWALTAGTFVWVGLDNGVVIPSAPSGSVAVSPTVTTTYRLFAVTDEGGVVAEATVYVDELPPPIFVDGFEAGNTSAWSAASL